MKNTTKEEYLTKIIQEFGDDHQKELLQEMNTIENNLLEKSKTDQQPKGTYQSYSDKFVKKQEIMSIKDRTERLKAIKENMEVFE